MVSTGYNSSGYPWPGAGLGKEPTANIGFMVTQQVPYPGKLDARAAVAAREADAEQQEIEAVRLSVASRVKQAYYRLAYAYTTGEVLTRNQDLLRTLVKVTEHRYVVGRAAQQDVIKAQTQLTILDLQLERLQQERATREGELNALLARPPSTPLGRPEDLPLPDASLSLDTLLTSAAAHAPMLKRDEVLIGRSQLAIAAARTDYKPDFSVSGGYYFMGAMPPMYEVRFDVTLPLQRAKRAAAVAEQVHAANAATVAYDATRLGLQSRIEEDFHRAETSARLARLYRDTVLPQARLGLESSMTSYQTGSVDFLSVVSNVGTVLEYEMTYYDELASYHAAVARLEEMTGSPLAR
jgi:outer membrane protein TolC